jgi:hypothetical protein
MAGVHANPSALLWASFPEGRTLQTIPTRLGMEENEKIEKHMKSIKLTLALALALIAMPLASHAYVWSSCSQWGTYSSGGYEFYCDEWGSSASECCYLNSVTSWNVVSAVPNGGGVKGYPNTARNSIGKSISSYSSSSSYSYSTPGGTYWDASFDCWVPTEVMVWEGNSGGVGPSGSQVYSNQSIDGASWNVYWQGGGPLSFLRVGNSGSGSQHLGTFFRWGASKGYFSSSNTVGAIGIGFEIFGSGGSNHTWYMNSCSIGT